VLLDRDETGRLVETTRWIVLGKAETEGSVALSDAGLNEVDEELASDALVPAGGNDYNGQFERVRHFGSRSLSAEVSD
jgi:hypothetical protein